MKKHFLTLTILFCFLAGANAQNKFDIEHLMDGTYRARAEKFGFNFENDDEYFYFDRSGEKHIVNKKGTERIGERKDKTPRTNEERLFLEFNERSKNEAFVRDCQVWVYNAQTNKERYLTVDGDSLNIIYGQSVHRNEFGIEKGLFLSDDGKHLAFYRMDQSMVGDYPLVNTQEREAKLETIKYPMAGMKSHEVLVYVYNFETDKTVILKTRKDNSLEEREMYLTNIAFSPDGNTVYIQKLNRLQNHLWLEAYDANNGIKKRTLLEESSKKYVEPEHPIVFIPNNPAQFLFFSEKDGWQHLYLYDTLGKEIKQLTKGEWMVEEVAGFNNKATECYFYGTKDSPLERNFYSLNLKNGKITRISTEHGTHYVSFNKTGTMFIDTYTSTDEAYRVLLKDNKGKTIKELVRCDNPMKQLSDNPEIIIDTLHAEDGTVLYTRMIRPKNFNPKKKYPVIVYVYNGPHAQLITDSYTAGAGFFLPFLAAQDYIVWTLDGRGSANRGYEFESAIWHNCGKKEMEDQMRGINYLRSLPYVDSERIGIDGWSYGGFMTLSLALNNPDVVKVATAGGPVIDWKWYEIMYGERYMGTPENNKEGYESSSVLNLIDNMNENQHILVMQGYLDNTVVPQHSLEFIRECVVRKKPVDYFMYTSHEHNVRGADRTELFKKIFRYYEDYLKK
ncbi:MAG: DPP IV N-terminal domain-containing protein [Bacteroidales bacterium]|nr:DPP IV N-terminal domain-containing protein [Bacteroidales bacterium]